MEAASREKEVLVITPEFPPDVGGVGRSVLRLCHLLTSLGYQPAVLVVRYSGQYTRPSMCALDVAGSKITVWQASCEIPGTAPAQQRRVLAQIETQASAVVGATRPGLVHLFFLGQLAYAGARACGEHGVPYIASARGSDINLGIDNPGRRPQLEEIFAHAGAATFVNHSMRRRAADLLRGRAIPCPVIYNSFWPASYAPKAPPEAAPPTDRPLVGAVVTNPEKKGLSRLVEICRADAPWTLSLLVPRPELVAPATREVLAAGLAMVTTLAPADVLSWYSRLSAYVQASPAEGCPNSLLEAVYCRIPTVCTAVGAAVELFEDGVSTLFVPVGDAPALWRAVECIVHDSVAARERAAAARRTLDAHCSLDVERSHWRTLYRKLLS